MSFFYEELGIPRCARDASLAYLGSCCAASPVKIRRAPETSSLACSEWLYAHVAKWAAEDPGLDELYTALPANLFVVAGWKHEDLRLFAADQAC